MDDVLFAGDTLSDAETFAREGMELFQSRGFKLRKWVANSNAKPVLQQIPLCDRASSVGKIDIGSQPLPDSSDFALDELIQAAPNLYTLKKRCAYLTAFVEFMTAKKLNMPFQKPCLDSSYLNKAFIKIVKFV